MNSLCHKYMKSVITRPGRRHIGEGQLNTVFTRLNAAAFIKFLAFPMWRLFKGSVYSRAAFIRGWRLFQKSDFLNHGQQVR